MNMKNPWPNLTENGNNYVLDIDKDIVSKHNLNSNENHCFHPELLPEPFIGNPNSSILALNANPGFNPEDFSVHSRKESRALILNNIKHELNTESNFYYLRPEFEGTPGGNWWRKRLRRLIEDCGEKTVSNNLFVLELIGYHSTNFKFIRVPSQEYNCYLIRKAISKGTLIIIMRSKKQWYGLVPELAGYSNCFIMKNPQSTYFSPNNINQYHSIINQLKGDKPYQLH